MKISGKKILKPLLITTAIILVVMFLIILFISPIAKFLIEKYDEKYSGRKIETGWVYLNPFTGYVHVSDLKIYESKKLSEFSNGDSVFFSAKGVSATFSLLKLFRKTVEISEISIDQPRGYILQNRKDFNFSDLISLLTPKTLRKAPSTIHFNIMKIRIIDGEFHYREELIPINYFIKKVNLESAGKLWSSDTIAAHVSLLPGIGSGALDGNFVINFRTLEYRFGVVVSKFDLNIIQQYLRDMTSNGIFSASLDANLKGRGNFADKEDLNASGTLAINEFHFGTKPDDDLASFQKLSMAIIEISPINHKYLFDSISLNQPFAKYERFDYLDNIQMMFGENGANIAAAAADPAKFNLIIEIARYVKVLAKNFFQSNYSIKRLAIYHGDLNFNDYAISEKFSAGLHPFYFEADSINKTHGNVNFIITSGIRPYGKAIVKVSINPKDSLDFDLHYLIQNIPVSLFNPYLVTYTSYPLDKGTLGLNGTWKVRDGMILSNNHILIMDPRRTKRVRNKDKKWLPLPLIMSLVRERGNVIDYQVPVTGNLKDPKFHLRDVLTDLVENIFVKPATTSYRLEVKNLEAEIEKSLSLKWEMRVSSLMRNQEKFTGKMAEYLKHNRDASLAVYPHQYADKEKEYILFYEAKKKYYLLLNHIQEKNMTEEDSEKVDLMSVKDSLFLHYLNNLLQDKMLYTIQEKCSAFVGNDMVEVRFNRLNKERKSAFLSAFVEMSVENRVIFQAGVNDIPYGGFSWYDIKYNGDLPSELVKAYRKMNELNNEVPRKKYYRERKKNHL